MKIQEDTEGSMDRKGKRPPVVDSIGIEETIWLAEARFKEV
jgi:hypothetical protein